MSSSIVSLSVFCDVLILCALGAAVASPRMSTLARPVIATFAFVCAWLVTAVFDALRAPAWTLFLGIAVIALSIGVVATTSKRGRNKTTAVKAEQAMTNPAGRDGLRRLLRKTIRAGGPSSSASLRCTLPTVREKRQPAVNELPACPHTQPRLRGDAIPLDAQPSRSESLLVLP